MAEFNHKTKGNSPPERKPRVYFTCHPEDFQEHFETVCKDIFATHDCAVYYTEDMTEKIEEQYKDSDLGQMNLFVIPVTFKLLREPNRAMDSDFRYAKENHIPVLPIMMETGLDKIYSQKDKFGELQYLSPCIQDKTAIRYEEKLKNYLNSVLISNETAERIRKAFDAYIFLSYRKKDRHHANALMKMIHNHPEFRDIAIWYDEFLKPGESFRENIEKMMQDSKLFTLLVTPNLLEYVDGKPNYVMEHEYPDAKKAGMEILPTEMVETDKTELRSKYKELPECINPMEDEPFRKRLADTLSQIAISENNEDPEHNFLVGLAYLDGIDVEKNTERGIELITMAAEANLLEAMVKLYEIYDTGSGAQVDYHKAAIWAERIVQYNQTRYGENAPETLTAMSNLAITYGDLGKHSEALLLKEKVYAVRKQTLGEKAPDTLKALSSLASTYSQFGDRDRRKKALALKEEVYALQCENLGEKAPDTVITLNNLASAYDEFGEYQRAFDLEEKAYKLFCEVHGEEHSNTLTALNNLAVTYGKFDKWDKALELFEKIYALRCKALGEEHPASLNALNSLAVAYGKTGTSENRRKEMDLQEKIYALRSKILGEEHPDTLATLNNLASTCGECGEHEKALQMKEKVYALACKMHGAEHPNTLVALNNLAATYSEQKKWKKALETFKKLYSLFRKVRGSKHPDTLTVMNNLAYVYEKNGYGQKAFELREKLCPLCCEVLGETHIFSLNLMTDLMFAYKKQGKRQKLLEMQRRLQRAIQRKELG